MSDKNSVNSVFQPNRPDQKTANHVRTTIVLALMLVMCLGAAKWMEFSRSGRQRMQEKAEALIQKVSQDKLTNYFKGQMYSRIYLIETEKGAVGFDAIYIEPLWEQGDNVRYRIRELFVMMDIGRRIESQFMIQDDLNTWIYSEQRTEANIQLEEKMEYIDGILTAGANYSSKRYQMSLKDQVSPMNVVPPGLFDLFVRLAAESNDAEGYEFKYPVIEPAGSGTGKVYFRSFDVKPGGEPPVEITPSATDHLVTIDWHEEDEHTPRLQYRLVDNRYQLVWSRDMFLGSTILVRTGRAHLVELMPQAAPVIQQWLADWGIDAELFWSILER